jgi:hypothetical protein
VDILSKFLPSVAVLKKLYLEGFFEEQFFEETLFLA